MRFRKISLWRRFSKVSILGHLKWRFHVKGRPKRNNAITLKLLSCKRGIRVNACLHQEQAAKLFWVYLPRKPPECLPVEGFQVCPPWGSSWASWRNDISGLPSECLLCILGTGEAARKKQSGLHCRDRWHYNEWMKRQLCMLWSSFTDALASSCCTPPSNKWSVSAKRGTTEYGYNWNDYVRAYGVRRQWRETLFPYWRFKPKVRNDSSLTYLDTFWKLTSFVFICYQMTHLFRYLDLLKKSCCN